MKTLVLGFISGTSLATPVDRTEARTAIQIYLAESLRVVSDKELQSESGYDKLQIVTGPANHQVSAIVREVAGKLNIPCKAGDGWGVTGPRFYSGCDVMVHYGRTTDPWCKQQETDFRRTKPGHFVHFIF